MHERRYKKAFQRSNNHQIVHSSEQKKKLIVVMLRFSIHKTPVILSQMMLFYTWQVTTEGKKNTKTAFDTTYKLKCITFLLITFWNRSVCRAFLSFKHPLILLLDLFRTVQFALNYLFNTHKYLLTHTRTFTGCRINA